MKTKLLIYFLALCGIANAQLTDSLVACYDFSGNANDGTGNGYNGTVVNATLTADRFGNPNSAYNFNGTTSNYITIPTANLNMNQYSYSAWVYLNSLPTTNNRYWVLSIGSAAGDQYLNYNTNSFGHGWGSGGYNSTTPHGFIYDNTTASLNQWYHLVVTRSATESKFYVNGVLVNSVSVSSTNSPYYGSGTLEAKIGIRFDNTDPFDGKIDDIRIYKKTLTSSEINQIYSTNLLVGLVACYDFSGNANDGTGNGYNGTVVNATLTADRLGNPNSAYNFNGTASNYINIPTANLNMSQYSYSAWVYLNSLPATNNRYWVLSIGSAAGDQYLNYNTNSFGHGWGSGGYNSTTPHGFIYNNTTATLNQWYHLVVTRSSTESKFYVNGVLVNSVSVSSTNSPYYGSGTLEAKIGIRFDNTDPFDGKIDDIRIYERPLTSGEVSSLYSSPTSCSSQSGDLTCNGFLSINENPLINYDLKLYPNPFSTQITIQTDNLLHNATLTVYNCIGQTVKQIKNISGQTITLFRDNLPSGLYCIRLTQDNKIITSDKLVITD